MYSVFVEVENSPLADATAFGTLDEVKSWVLLQLDMYSNIGENVKIEVRKLNKEEV